MSLEVTLLVWWTRLWIQVAWFQMPHSSRLDQCFPIEYSAMMELFSACAVYYDSHEHMWGLEMWLMRLKNWIFNSISMNLNNHMWLLTTVPDSRARDDTLLGKNFQEQFFLFGYCSTLAQYPTQLAFIDYTNNSDVVGWRDSKCKQCFDSIKLWRMLTSNAISQACLA